MRVAIVIPMWNQLELTLRCLRSVRALVPPPESIIIVDNASSPDPCAALTSTAGPITVLRLERNHGFAGGCNTGIRHAIAGGAEAVLLLNSDTVCDRAMLGELVRVLGTDPGLAAVGAKALTDEASPRIDAAYSVLTFHAPLVRVEGWHDPQVDKFNDERDVDSVSFAAVLMRREALEQVGLLDEEFFAYHEDVDWCTRARRAGWRIRYVPSAVLYHRRNASTEQSPSKPVTYFLARNSVLFVRKNADLVQALTFGLYTAASLVRQAISSWWTGDLDRYRMRLRGIRDGLLGRAVPLQELGLAQDG